MGGDARRHGGAALRGPQTLRLDHSRRTAGQAAVLYPCLRASRSWPPAGCCSRRAPGKLGALAAVALFIAVFPANVNMVRLWKDKPLPMRIGAIARLPLQIPMITQAIKIYRNA